MPEKREHQTFHVGLKAFIADGEKLLILQDTEGLWELPGGRTEKSEIHKDLREILAREAKEELGEALQYEIGPIFHAWIRKPDPIKDTKSQYRDNDFCIFLVGFQCAYQKGEIQLSPEHQAFKWITKEEVDSIEFENTYKEAVQYYFQGYPY
ncbi:MAG: hypothetical protein Greene041639_79 [Parcubacteria group bacterium Greene0416_39]|nr:MAG: hypothetical protein Greene041639_79 [Parcubacteria group bacterium Greene0416_39]TSC98190.1 MAG: hypothetical protein Greene101447_153 [Parcubacteria group bacterium Greene1014_47]